MYSLSLSAHSGWLCIIMTMYCIVMYCLTTALLPKTNFPQDIILSYHSNMNCMFVICGMNEMCKLQCVEQVFCTYRMFI